MKKWIGTMFLMTLMHTAFAQDFKNVENSLILRNFESAKKEYEKVILKKPNLDTTAEGFYFKSRIYAGFAIDPDTSKNQSAYDKLIINLESYISKDKKFEIASKKGVEPFFVVYAKSANLGQIAFNEKKWKNSALEFEKALFYSDIIYSNDWGEVKQPFDTIRLIFAGYSNQNAGNVGLTLKYYQRMIEANMTAPELIEIYKYVLVQYIDTVYTQNKEVKKAQFDKYYVFAEKAYPQEKWFEFRADYIDKNLTAEEKIAAYEAQIAANTINETECQMYGDMFMASRNVDGLSDEKANYYLDKAADAYMRAYKLNNQNYAAAINVGISYYNQYRVLDDQVGNNIRALQQLNSNKPVAPKLNSNKPVAPKDTKKKLAFDAAFKAQQDSIKKLNLALDAPIKAKVDQAIEWIENAFVIINAKERLNKDEKNVGSRSVDLLATLYSEKRDKNRANQKLYDELDNKFNKYDQLHDDFVVKIGSTKKQVLKLMGQPNSISTTQTKSNSYELYLYDKEEIGFDKNGIVDYKQDIKK